MYDRASVRERLYESKRVKNNYDNWNWHTGKLTIFLDLKVPWRYRTLAGLTGGSRSGNSFLKTTQPRGMAKGLENWHPCCLGWVEVEMGLGASALAGERGQAELTDTTHSGD